MRIIAKKGKKKEERTNKTEQTLGDFEDLIGNNRSHLRSIIQ